MSEVQFAADGLVLSSKRWSEETQDVIEFSLSSAVPCVLHWGLKGLGGAWKRPEEKLWPEGSRSADAMSVDTTFVADEAGRPRVVIKHPKPIKSRALAFVLYFPETKRWVKDGANDYCLPLKPAGEAADLSEVVDLLAEAEVNSPYWTLMHRYNLCHDLLYEFRTDEQIMALLFVWMRFSAIRQLTWQRQFNTKPRELSHSLNRLTMRLAGMMRQGQAPAFWVRQILSTLGRGGEGQRVRDEILHIMHRHHIKETHGRFMEEWHQKLHNNTTIDDVVICEAYLAFLRSRGDLSVFYSTLEQGGVSRERMRTFERPIKTDPDYNENDAGGLINDFSYYLGVLKSLHSGTDFDSAHDAAIPKLEDGTKKILGEFKALRNSNSNPVAVAERLTAAREALPKAFANAKDDGALRDLLFLDLALEAQFRQIIEKQEHSAANVESFGRLLDLALRQILLTNSGDEWRFCSKHWAAVMSAPKRDGGWAFHAISVAGRLGRAVQDSSTKIHSDLQPKAEQLGKALKVQDWTLPLFSEEVVRGNILFIVSVLLRHLESSLRSSAGLGGWQVVSLRPARGKVQVVESLMSVQGQRFSEPTVLVTDKVSGNEDIPEGVSAVITTSTLDLVSHAAIRARNGGILCATCFDEKSYAALKKSDGLWISLEVNAAGDVQHHVVEGESKMTHAEQVAQKSGLSLRRRKFTSWAIPSAEFNTDVVGGKSNNLNRLRGRTPDWIHFPKSIALPFGVFEHLLDQNCNRQLKAEYTSLLENAERDLSPALLKLRTLIAGLQSAPEFESALRETWEREQLPPLVWPEAWTAIKRVWASKWNDRAYLSRRALGILHDELSMAVLIQEVVEADYAFVIHTANPITSDLGEIYGEIVLGMGETLVGNHPGSAMGFIYSKSLRSGKIVSYPAKTFGLYGSGMIFRSDSNGEDLDDFAGAGLYDSVLGREPEMRRLDYSGAPLIWDAAFRDTLIENIARIGLETEKLFDVPQDIEGAVSGDRYFVVQTRSQVGLK